MICANFGRIALAPATPPEAALETLTPETLENEKSLSPKPLAQHIRALGADGKRGGSMPTRPWAVARARAARYARLARKEMDRDLEMLRRLWRSATQRSPFADGHLLRATCGGARARISTQHDPKPIPPPGLEPGSLG